MVLLVVITHIHLGIGCNTYLPIVSVWIVASCFLWNFNCCPSVYVSVRRQRLDTCDHVFSFQIYACRKKQAHCCVIWWAARWCQLRFQISRRVSYWMWSEEKRKRKRIQELTRALSDDEMVQESFDKRLREAAYKMPGNGVVGWFAFQHNIDASASQSRCVLATSYNLSGFALHIGAVIRLWMLCGSNLMFGADFFFAKHAPIWFATHYRAF